MANKIPIIVFPNPGSKMMKERLQCCPMAKKYKEDATNQFANDPHFERVSSPTTEPRFGVIKVRGYWGKAVFYDGLCRFLGNEHVLNEDADYFQYVGDDETHPDEEGLNLAVNKLHGDVAYG
jgi:hypothetical protein